MTYSLLATRRTWRFAWCTSLLLGPLLWCAQASAFESDEHRIMSDLALAVARSMVNAQMPPGERLREVDAAMDALQGHYGGITACVDYFLTPEKILDLPWAINSPAFASRDGLPELGHYPLGKLEQQCSSWSLRLIQASHSNHSHFQQDLMMALRVSHMAAVSVAQPAQGAKGNVFGGLFINAISDHYLQDFFAPGHIVTPRVAMTDLQATAMHDLANKMGAEFRPNLQTPGLKAVLLYLCPAMAGSPDTSQCESPKGVPLELLADAHLEDRAAGIRALLTPHPKPIKFKGDGQLRDDEQLVQRLFLLAVQVRSILDVIDGQNHLQDMSFYFDRDQGRPDVDIYFGRYAFEHEGEKVSTSEIANVQSVRKSTSSIVWPNLPICSFGQCKDRLYPLRSSSPVFSISDHRESQSKGAYPGRSVYMVEMSWAGTLIDLSKWPGGFLSAVQMTPSLGYAKYKQFRERGEGPSLRLSFAVPETELSLGPYVRRLTYSDQGKRVGRNGFGLQIEEGFSSYVTFYLLWGLDQSTDVQGRLQAGRMWGGGVRISAPLTRLAFFN